MTAEENVEALRRLYASWARGDLGDLEIYDPDIEIVWTTDVPDASADRGIDGLQATMRRFMDAWEDIRITAERFVPAGDKVVVMINWSAVGRATKLRLEMTRAHVWTFAGGKATRIEGHVDLDEALVAVGLERED